MTDKNKFHGDVGRFLTGQDARSRTARYKRYKQEKGYKPDTFARAEFFGINRINKLLGRKDCVGIRIYYGKTHEDVDGNVVDDGQGELKSRLVLVGVRADGTDIFDDPTGRKDPGDGDALGDGFECPRHCGNPPSSL
ncbi:hypothetical protein [Fibrella forsythiae]|uniref:Uncharacterized protein n=1 Tax=Fibrella forsythiae TaxID=2817061 RepID=A0ABS3JFJ6_9BACT|nr:hypothetical protein [Fibrella forsythiae]MBO0948768.1 hypothetical protein [Fibrella forsythiae]